MIKDSVISTLISPTCKYGRAPSISHLADGTPNCLLEMEYSGVYFLPK